MVGKMARVVGPFMWAFISSTLGFGQPAAVLALVFCLLVSYAILTRVRAPMASPTADLAD
jgi:MFS-type transporter involved in bile tolerance (Atg22 family)